MNCTVHMLKYVLVQQIYLLEGDFAALTRPSDVPSGTHFKEWLLCKFPNNAIHSWKWTTENNSTRQRWKWWRKRMDCCEIEEVILAISLKDLSSWEHHDVWENQISSRSESSCPNENEVDDAAAPVSITTPDELKSPSPIVNRLRPRLRPKN